MKIQINFLVVLISLTSLARGFGGGAPPSQHDPRPAQSPARTDDRLSAVAYGRGRFVAVGDAGVILTSTNGNIWILQRPVCTERLAEALPELRFEGAGKEWVGDFANSRVRIRWFYSVSGRQLRGRVVLLDSGKVGRRVRAYRAPRR